MTLSSNITVKAPVVGFTTTVNSTIPLRAPPLTVAVSVLLAPSQL